MPSKKAVQSEAVVSTTSKLAPVKVARKRVPAKATEAAASAPATTKSAGARKKIAVAVDTPVAAVTHRHKKQDLVTSAAVGTALAYEPGHDEVARLAYSYYVARGYQSGNQGADWFRAVQELKQRHLASLLSDTK